MDALRQVEIAAERIYVDKKSGPPPPVRDWQRPWPTPGRAT
ncbi:hypothetical protein [Kocuria aegyptia]